MVEKQLIYGKNQYLKQDNFNAYFNEYQKILQSSDGYYKLESLISHIDRVSIDAQVVNLNVRVWIYSKVLDELIDVSPLVVACNTSKNMAMGAFSITLNPAKVWSLMLNIQLRLIRKVLLIRLISRGIEMN